jgi:hypothetical protein
LRRTIGSGSQRAVRADLEETGFDEAADWVVVCVCVANGGTMTAAALSKDAQQVQACLTATPQYYGLVNLALASLAYTDEFGPKAYLPPNQVMVVNDLSAAIAAQPQLPMPGSTTATLAGSWQVVWGPAYPENDYSNLMYVATYTDANSTPANAPVFAVVSIRGTDTNLGDDPAGLLNQIVQDMAADVLANWTDTVNGNCLIAVDPLVKKPRIARGTCKGLQKLLGLTPVNAPGNGTTLVQFLTTLLTDNPGLPIVVTGHSLGGCLTTVMAPYLQQTLGLGAKQIIPTPFAPPTAGNDLFATTILDTMPLMNAWANTLDLVPMAYDDVKEISTLWQDYSFSQPKQAGPSMPSQVTPTYQIIEHIASLGYNYTQPTTGFNALTTGTNPQLLPSQADMQAFLKNLNSGLAWESWLAQLMWQHFPPCYWQLMNQQFTAAQVARYPYPKVPQTTNPRLA